MPPLFATFVAPLLALGAAAAAAAVPVLIHLLSRQRHRVVPWAAIRFLLAAQKRHRRRIDRWLLLAARVLALLLPLAAMCAVMPWAEGVWQSVWPGPTERVSNLPRTHHVLVLDASLSMTAKVDGETRFDRAVRAAEQVVRDAGPGDGFTLFVLGAGAGVGAEGTAVAQIPGPTPDKEKVLADLAAVRVTHGACDYLAALKGVADTLDRSPRNYPRRQVTVFTDAQRSAWAAVLAVPPANPPDAWKRVLPRADVAVIDVAGADVPNVSVADVFLANPLALVDQPNAVLATIRNHSTAARRGVRVELLLARPAAVGADAALSPVKEVTLDALEPNKPTIVTFPLDDALRFREVGPHLLQVRLTGDELPADDTRTLAVSVRAALPTLVVNGRGGEFAATALDPPVGDGKALSQFRVKTVGLAEFAEPTLSDLSAVDCLVLHDLPAISPAQVGRIEALLKRGGGVILVLGPNAAANLDGYNRVLFDPKGGGLLPGKLLGVKESGGAGEADFRLFAEEKAFEQDPLAAFRVGNARATLTDVPFKKYVVLDAPTDGRARRILSFTPGNPAKLKPEQVAEKPAPAVVEWPRQRGKVAVVTTALSKEWGEWPSAPSFLPFVQELARHLCTNPNRLTLAVGDSLEDSFPAVAVGQSATVFTPDGRTEAVPLTAGDDMALLRFPETLQSGLYRVRFGGRKDSVFAVNPPDSTAGGESDLTRVSADTLRGLGPSVQVVNDLAELRFAAGDGGEAVLTAPKPRGPTIARWLLTAGLLFLALEIWLAWRVGPSRATGGLSVADKVVNTGRPWVRWVWVGVGGIPLLLAVGLLAAVAHSEATGQPLGFLPESGRSAVESALGVPSAGPGEGTRWRLESEPVYRERSRPRLLPFVTDSRLLIGLVGLVGVVIVGLYFLERRAAGKFGRLLLPLGLRLAAVLLIGFLLLPQWRLGFDREGWPDVAVILDTSASMSTADDLRDPAIRAKADELAGVVGGVADRLALAKVLLTRPDAGWLDRLVREKQVKVHVFSLAAEEKEVVEIQEAAGLPAAKEAVNALTADGPASQLGDGVRKVLKRFRGGSLAAAIVFTDGQTTAGEELSAAGRAAARQGVPLYLVGFGESRDYPDLELADLRADDVVYKGDQLVFEARLTARGPNPPTAVPVILSERQGEALVERARVMVSPDPGGKPVPVKLTITPTEAGEKSFVIDVPPLPAEVETGNNRLEKVVLVTDSRKLRVLYVEGYARYEYRFVKAQLEREVDAAKGTPVELGVLLQDGSAFFHKLDKSVLESFPTKAQLFEYDAVILGDIDPAKLERANTFFADLAEFVKARGGGLLVIAGEHHVPHKLFDTPLADLLPIAPSDGAARGGPPAPTPENNPIADGYRLRLTPLGRSHPLFRFDADDGAKRLDALKPFFWAATGYKRKPAAEVLATHPDRPADGDPGSLHPLAVQQFYGRGRVMFFGFEETWRWRFRADEERFNQFWTQAVRALARTRVTKVELKTDRQTAYRKGEPMRVTLRYPDDAPAPPDGATVKLRMQRQPLRLPGGGLVGETETRTVELTKVANTRGEFQAVVTRTPEGEYLFQVAEGVELPGGTRPRAEARVLPPPGERDRVEMNRTELERAASESRGKFYTLADADKLLADLPDAPRLPLNQPVPPLGVWNHAALFGLLVALLAVEWWVRRRERLV